MKKFLLGLLLPALILYGCSASGAANNPSGISPQNTTTQVETKGPDSKDAVKDTPDTSLEETKPVEGNAPNKKEAPKVIVSNDYKFESVPLENAPQNIADIYEKNKEQYKLVVADDGNHTYIIAMMGEKRTAGYSIKVLSIEDNEEGRLKVTAELKQPSKDEMVAQVITYPVDIVRIQKTNLPIYAVDTNSNKVSVEDKR